jgi:hypothetical protein
VNGEAAVERRSSKPDFSLFRRLGLRPIRVKKLAAAVLELRFAPERYFPANGTDFTRFVRLRLFSELVERAGLTYCVLSGITTR